MGKEKTIISNRFFRHFSSLLVVMVLLVSNDNERVKFAYVLFSYLLSVMGIGLVGCVMMPWMMYPDVRMWVN